MTDVLEKLIVIQQTQINTTGASTITPNIESDLGVCPLYFAIHQNNIIATKLLFFLGASPLYQGDDEPTVLYSIINEHKWQFAELLVQNLQQRIGANQVSSEDICMLKNEFSELPLTESMPQLIQNFVISINSLPYDGLVQQYKPDNAPHIHLNTLTLVDQSVQTDSDEEVAAYSPDTSLVANVEVVEDHV